MQHGKSLGSLAESVLSVAVLCIGGMLAESVASSVVSVAKRNGSRARTVRGAMRFVASGRRNVRASQRIEVPANA